jgi:hypothetical protein
MMEATRCVRIQQRRGFETAIKTASATTVRALQPSDKVQMLIAGSAGKGGGTRRRPVPSRRS